MEKSMKPPCLVKDDRRGEIMVWIVDGSCIRGHIDEEFTNFRQHKLLSLCNYLCI